MRRLPGTLQPPATRSTDAAGNTTSHDFTITVEDTTDPEFTAPDDILAEATSANGAPVNYLNPMATDIVSGSLHTTCLASSGSTFALGNTTVTCTATDGANNTSAPKTFKVKVGPKPTTTTLSLSASVIQYSDPITFSGSVSLNNDGSYSGKFPIMLTPGTAASPLSYNMTAIFTPANDNPYFKGSTSDPQSLTVRPENARPVGQVAYTGQRVFRTPTTTSSTATVTLAATIMDVSASACPAAGYPDCDPWPGNITKANVTFYTRDPAGTTRVPINKAQPL